MTHRRTTTVATTTLALALAALVACSGPAGEPREWWLVGRTPDGQLLQLVTAGGGCHHLAGWTSRADGRSVTVEARWEDTGETVCIGALRIPMLVLDLGEPLGDRELHGCLHDDCLALHAEGGPHRGFPPKLTTTPAGVLATDHHDVWGLHPDGEVAWHAPIEPGREPPVEERWEPTDDDTGVDATLAPVDFDGEGTWLEVHATTTGERLHRLRVADVEANMGPPTALGDGRIVLAEQRPDRLLVVDPVTGHIEELASAGGRVQGVVDGVVILEGETRTRGVDVESDEVLWEAPRARGGERFVVGDGALVVFDRHVGSVALLDPTTGEVRWRGEVGTVDGVAVAATGDRLLVVTSTAAHTFDLATGAPHGWRALVPARTVAVGGEHPPDEWSG